MEGGGNINLEEASLVTSSELPRTSPPGWSGVGVMSPGSREAEVRFNAPEVFSRGPDVFSKAPEISKGPDVTLPGPSVSSR